MTIGVHVYRILSCVCFPVLTNNRKNMGGFFLVFLEGNSQKLLSESQSSSELVTERVKVKEKEITMCHLQ